MLLDLGMLAALAVAAPTVTWPMALAVAASSTRVALTAHTLPQAFAR